MSFVAALRETLRAAFADEQPREEELFALLKQQNFPEALSLLTKSPQLWAARDQSGHSPLHWAALGGCTSFVLPALVAHVPVDVQAADAQTPLMWAVCGGHTSMVEALLNARADLLVRDSKGASMFIVAIHQGHHTVAQLLAERGPPDLPAACDNSGCTAADWAAHLGCVASLALLEALGVELNAPDSRGMLPLHYAALGGQSGAASFLLERSGDVAARGAGGKTCLDIAKERRDRSLQALVLRWAFRKQLRQHSCFPPTPSRGPASSLYVESWAPVASGAALCWRLEEPCQVPAPDESDGAALEEYGCSHDDLLRAMLRRIQHCDKACIWAVGHDGTPIDLTMVEQTPSPGCFPLQLRSCQAGPLQVSAADIECELTRHMRAQLSSFDGCVLTPVPPELRWTLWKNMLQVESQLLPRGESYKELSQCENEWTPLITADVHRTFKGFSELQHQALHRILNAYAGHNVAVGYCQGMNRIAGLLLLISGSDQEEECFGVLTCLMDHLGLASFFQEGFPGLNRCVAACNCSLEEREPELMRQFTQQGVDPAMCVRQWLLTLFTDCLPLPLVVSVWDAIIEQGLSFTVCVTLAMLESLREMLLGSEFSDVTDAIKVLQRGFAGKGSDCLWLGQLLVDYAKTIPLPEGLP